MYDDEYKVLFSETPDALAREVEDSIRHGWKPCGGVSNPTTTFGHFSQAMTRTEHDGRMAALHRSY